MGTEVNEEVDRAANEGILFQHKHQLGHLGCYLGYQLKIKLNKN